MPTDWPALDYKPGARRATPSTPTPRCWASSRWRSPRPSRSSARRPASQRARLGDASAACARWLRRARVTALGLRTHEAVAEHSDGRAVRVALCPARPVAEVTRRPARHVPVISAELVKIEPEAPGEHTEAFPLTRAPCARATAPINKCCFAATTQPALLLPSSHTQCPILLSPREHHRLWKASACAADLFSRREAIHPQRLPSRATRSTPRRSRSAGGQGHPRYRPAAFFAYARPAPDGCSEATAVPRRRPLRPGARHISAQLGRRPRSRRPRLALAFSSPPH